MNSTTTFLCAGNTTWVVLLIKLSRKNKEESTLLQDLEEIEQESRERHKRYR